MKLVVKCFAFCILLAALAGCGDGGGPFGNPSPEGRPEWSKSKPAADAPESAEKSAGDSEKPAETKSE